MKKYLGSKYVEPTLNHEMVRAVLTERQTSDCDVKCRITFIKKENYCSRMWNSKHWVGPNFYQFDQWKVNDRLFFIRYTFSKISQARVFVASKHYGNLEKKQIKNWMCKSHDPFFYFFSIQALLLELANKRRFATLAALAINYMFFF